MFSQRERKKNACHGLFLVTPESDLGAICVFGMRRKRSGQPELVSGTLAGRMPAPGRSGRARLTGRERAGYGGLMGRKGREETRGVFPPLKAALCALTMQRSERLPLLVGSWDPSSSPHPLTCPALCPHTPPTHWNISICTPSGWRPERDRSELKTSVSASSPSSARPQPSS
jgi:hypothetical protein